MPEIVRRTRFAGLTAVITTTALLAVACGSSSTTVEVGANPVPSQETGSTAEASEAATPADEPDDGAAAESAPETNLFPDIEVVNVADSSTFNLAAELGGGDLPVLLWFWAPH